MRSKHVSKSRRPTQAGRQIKLAPERAGKRKWFAAALLFVSKVGDVPHLRPLCEERVVVLAAGSEKEALAKIAALGRDAGHDYRNVYGDLVVWEFVATESLAEIDRPTDGVPTEVYSRFTRRALRTLGRLQK